MLLKTVFIRFYKSFNYDFLRKNNAEVKPKLWEKVDNTFYPYIEVPIEQKITTIVGANESGKSHLLSAIEKAITGEKIVRRDFCRYSPFFTVRQDELKYPDFGTEWASLSKSEDASIRKIIEVPDNLVLERFLVFRNNVHSLSIYLPEKGDYRLYKIGEEQSIELQMLLPKIIKIESDVALPSSVPIKKLVELGQDDYLDSKRFELLDQQQRNKIVDALDVFSDNPEVITKVRGFLGEKREEIEREAIDSIKAIISSLGEMNFSDDEKKLREERFKLAYKLICEIAEVDTKALLDLSEAIQDDNQGYANGIVERINRQLASNLNFPSYWVQDRNFCLKVMARAYDLVFTITDQTGTEYSFNERSQGLRYFLSYYIQYRSHKPHSSKSEILLMDEPDTYLSSQAQQDLLKVFDSFASPEPGSHLKDPIQVAYVTHSPFLIDKNHTERIRVLQKGMDDEGTRVVRDFAQNRYQPLTSSIGPHVGESVFIGNCNLMVEGISDQIIIAGAARYLRAKGISNLDTLDLNQITIVDSGGANQIPYMVYLACGRHTEQIAVIVLLDSDDSGNNAKKQLLGRSKGGQHRKPLLKEQFILQLADIIEEFSFTTNTESKKLEIEDIVPLEICIQATKIYLQELLQIDETELSFLSRDLVLDKIKDQTILDTIRISLSEFPNKDLEIDISKNGFARNIIRVINDWSQRQDLDENQRIALQTFEKNFRALFKKLNIMQRRAQQKLTGEKLAQKIERIKKDFNSRHPNSARREHGTILLDEIEGTLDSNKENESSMEIEAINSQIQNLRRDYKLDIETNKAIDDYPGFQMGLERIKYAGLLASQEKTIEEPQLEKISAEVSEEAQISESLMDVKAEIDGDDAPSEPTKSTDNSAKNNTRKKLSESK